ncbi:MAG: bifunctional 4-hydroxy-2-oxoglutarate aldolase/2-dehydro-3-deoxy-phosphogluconate aldolase [Marinobacter sp.]|uniref:bifunctional 4-hydroxy-2-oxoglutarate aldolase/2-dehydro-3-deoxy-phosphogluconate aldolase n=1 Tax=Marinobacter sp. TaxID=50741 RepID=UPI00299F3C0C|nr:bifunctional 4-hydroxy-2-oxoglutarate aldolase/2-dehydro-3-deoxy-phosphogluconate aldolase [Marinobacter sp.]MDX1755641.1 bifunctional 4-hydroxy-2-oxoglutarate aldolase/2-dehydro-3-deoxy-phosphogluconate aldolase [Marinobacter sp.]
MQQLSEVHRNRIHALFHSGPLIPVITIEHPDQVLPLCQALVDGGIRALEITLRTEYGLPAIERLRATMPEIWVGAGTVVTRAQYREVESAGAQFVVSPGVTEPLLDFGLTSSVPLLPGIATVSELMLGYSMGYREFKFFPASVAGGPDALQAFAGPFPDVSFCPTGGIRPDTAADYLALDNVLGVGGTWLTPSDAIAAGDWRAISKLTRDSLVSLGRLT